MKKKANIISTLALTLLILDLAAGIYTAIKFESFWLAFVGAMIAWISFIFLSSYADVVRTVDENSEMLRELIKASATNTPRAYTVSNVSATPARAVAPATTATAPTANPAQSTATATPAGSDFITCSNCGTRQRSNRTVCYECGAKFEEK